MPEEQLHPILQHLRRRFWGAGSLLLTDRQLLERYAQLQDETAFAALVQRHGPMVYGVCRRVLRRVEDAEDAFQATFMVLARKAAALAWRESVSRWLYQVAYRVAAEVRTRNARRDALDKQAAQRRKPADADPESLRDVCAVLDEALQGLPARYQEPLVLCYLEGLTRDQAAGQLGWSLRTLERRLAQGRERLRRVLTHRGVTLSAGLLASSLTAITTARAASSRRIAGTMRAALAFATGKTELGGGISATAAALAESALHSTVAAPARIVPLLALLLALAAGGLGVFVVAPAWRTDPPAERQAAAPRQGDESLPPRRDRLGDPLPPEAIVRLGTIRFRAPAEAQALAFAPDGKTVAVSSYGGLFLFDAGSGKRLKRLGDFSFTDRPDNAVVFSPDGKRLAARGHVVSKDKPISYKSVLRVWQLASDEKPRVYDAEHLIWIGWSAASEPLAACLEKDGLWLRQLRSGQARYFECPNLGRPNLFRAEGRFCACAPPRLLAVVDGQDVVHVWDLATGKKSFTLEPEKDGYPGGLGGLAVAPDGRHLAVLKRARAAPYLNAAQILDAATGRTLHTVATGQMNLAALAFSPDSKTLAAVGWDGIHCWDVASGRERSRSQGEGADTARIAFSGDGQTLATLKTHSGMFQIWDVATGKGRPQPVGHTSRPYGTAFSPDGRRVASGGGLDGTIQVWDLADSKALFRIHRPSHWVRDVAWSRDGRWLYSTWTDDELWIADAATGERKHVIKLADPERPDTRQNARAMHLSADGQTLVAVSNYRKGNGPNYGTLITGWNPVTRKQLFHRSLPGLDPTPTLSDDARLLAVPYYSRDPELAPGKGPLRLVELATGEALLRFPSLDGQTSPLPFSPDGRFLAACNFNYKRLKEDDPTSTASRLFLWEVATAREVLSLPLAGQARAAFSPDGRLLALTALGSILVWDLAEGGERRRFKGFDGEVTWLAFSPDGRRLISGHADSTLLVWEVPAPPSPRKAKLGPERLARAWADLAADDAASAFRARWALASAPEAALPLLARHLQPTRPADPQQLRQLLADLDSPQFAVRTAAQKELETLGELAAPALRQTLAKKPSLELRQRAQALLDKLRGPVTGRERLRAVRAVAVLEDTATAEARNLLATLAQGAPGARLTQEARAALGRLRQQPAP